MEKNDFDLKLKFRQKNVGHCLSRQYINRALYQIEMPAYSKQERAQEQNKIRPTSAYSNTTHNFLREEHMQSIFENIRRHA